jgi:hypothetical protein
MAVLKNDPLMALTLPGNTGKNKPKFKEAM